MSQKNAALKNITSLKKIACYRLQALPDAATALLFYCKGSAPCRLQNYLMKMLACTGFASILLLAKTTFWQMIAKQKLESQYS
jgi:hypothetical protein